MCLKKKKTIEKKLLSCCCTVLTTLCSPLKEWLVWLLYLVTCWPGCEKNDLKCFSKLMIVRKKNWTFSVDLLLSTEFKSALFCESSHFMFGSLPPPCFHFVTSLFEFDRKFFFFFRGLRISKSNKSIGAMSFVFCWTSMNCLLKLPWSWPKWIDVWSLTLFALIVE